MKWRAADMPEEEVFILFREICEELSRQRTLSFGALISKEF